MVSFDDRTSTMSTTIERYRPNKREKSARRYPRSLMRATFLVMLILIQVIYGKPTAAQGGQGTRKASQGASTPEDKCIQQKYRPEGPVGIRYRKQIMQERDQSSGVFDSHMIESAFKKKHFLTMFSLGELDSYEEDFQLQQLCPSTLYPPPPHVNPDEGLESQEAVTTSASKKQDHFCQLPPRMAFASPEITSKNNSTRQMDKQVYLSTQLYKPRFSHLQALGQANKGEGVANGGIQIQIQGAENPQEMQKDNHYLNLALGVKPFYEIPVSALDQMDQEQTIEGFLFKKAKHNNLYNFNSLREALGGDEKLTSLAKFQSQTFTYEDPDRISNLTRGLRPIQIQKLKPQHSLYRFFTAEVEITPQKTSFDECQLLIAKYETIRITNRQRKKDLELKTMLASSPELSFYPPKKLQFPITIKPQESIDIKVAYTPETLGLFESVMYVVLDDGWTFVSTFNAYVVPNAYEIHPFYMTDILVNQQIEIPLYITNPSSTDTLIIEDLYSTESDVKLKWPNSGSVISPKVEALNDNGESVISYYLIPEGSRKVLVNMVFESNKTMDFYVEIHILTSLHDLIRVPLYFHVHSDSIKFSPSVVDFGLAPLNFDILKIPLYAKTKIAEPLVLIDIQLPLSEGRIDFQMVDFTRSNNILRKNKDMFLGYALLFPVQPGPIETKIIVIMQGSRTNKTYTLDLPVVGSVHSEPNVFGAKVVVNSNDPQYSYPLPLVSFDVQEYQVELLQGQKRKIYEKTNFKSIPLQAPLKLQNTFKVPIVIKGVVNTNPDIKVTLLGNQNGGGAGSSIIPQDIILMPGQTLTYANVDINTGKLKVGSSNKYISILVNNTMIPVAIAIYDRALLCQWEEQEGALNIENVPFCNVPYEANFDYVAINDAKQKRLKITNLNPVNITIEQVAKQQLDDLNIFIEKVVDRYANDFPVMNGESATDSNILGPKRTRRSINYPIQPFQTVVFVFQVLAKEPKQKFSRIDFTIKDSDSTNFSFNYKYHVIQGSLSIVPQVIKFNPTFPGLPQTKTLVARSTFDVPVTVRTIISNDMRLIPQVLPVMIKPNNKTEFGALTFDPSKHQLLQGPGIGGIPAPLFHQPLQLNNIDLSSLFGHQHQQPSIVNIDPAVQQNLINLLNGLQNGNPQPNLQQQIALQLQKTQQQLQMAAQQQQQQQTGIQYQMQSVITPGDIEYYRHKQMLWEAQQQHLAGSSKSSSEFSTQVTLETNVYQNITVSIRAQLRKVDDESAEGQGSTGERGSIAGGGLQADPLDFEYVQVGTSQMKSLRVVNPNDEPIIFSLFITTQEVYDQLAHTRKANNTTSKPMLHVPPPQALDQDYYFQAYCNSRLQGYKAPEQSEIKITSAKNQNLKHVCGQVQQVFSRLLNYSNEDATTIRRRIDTYFKELHLAEMQKDIQNQNDASRQIGGVAKDLFGKQIKSSMEQVMSQQSFSTHTSTLDINNLLSEIENITNSINMHTHARLLDQATLSLFKANYEKQRQQSGTYSAAGVSMLTYITSNLPDFYTVVDTLYTILKTLLIGRPSTFSRAHHNLTSQAKQEKQRKDAMKQNAETPPRLFTFKLRNSVMNEVIVNNDTQKLFADQSFARQQLFDPNMLIYTGQSFFINPKCQGQTYKVDPHSDLTIRDAIIFQPQSLINSDQEHMKLILKNNLTLLQGVDVKGKAGTGILEVVKILKKGPVLSPGDSDHYVKTHTLAMKHHTGGGHPGGGGTILTDSSTDFSQLTHQSIRDRILHNVYGPQGPPTESGAIYPQLGYQSNQREMIIRSNYRYGINQQLFVQEGDPSALPFHITQEDIFIQQHNIVKADQDFYDLEHSNQESQEGVFIQERDNVYYFHHHHHHYNQHRGANGEQVRLNVQSKHKRVLVIQNTGNLPLSVDSISLDGQGCKTQNFLIENCNSFTLKPGSQHQLHIWYRTDYTLAKLKKKLVLETKQGVIQEFTLEVIIPVDQLKMAHDMLPLTKFEEIKILLLKLILVLIAFATSAFVANDFYTHLKFKKQQVKEHEQRILYFEDQPPQVVKTGGSKKDSLPAVLREYIPNDQVYNLYCQAQDKLLDRSGVGKSSQNQMLLLKEVTNICSKKTLVCMEAQRQAIEAEKESRRVVAMRHQQFLQQQQAQAQAKARENLAAVKEQRHQAVAPVQSQIPDSSSNEAAPPSSQAKTDNNVVASKAEAPKVANTKNTSAGGAPSQIAESLKPSAKQQLQQSRDTIFSDISMNDSALMNQSADQIIQGDDTKQDSKNTATNTGTLTAAQQAAKLAPKISKKDQKRLAQRLKEQQEAEERFKQQQIERQKREELEAMVAAQMEAKRLEIIKNQKLKQQMEEQERQQRLQKMNEAEKQEVRLSKSSGGTREDLVKDKSMRDNQQQLFSKPPSDTSLPSSLQSEKSNQKGKTVGQIPASTQEGTYHQYKFNQSSSDFYKREATPEQDKSADASSQDVKRRTTVIHDDQMPQSDSILGQNVDDDQSSSLNISRQSEDQSEIKRREQDQSVRPFAPPPMETQSKVKLSHVSGYTKAPQTHEQQTRSSQVTPISQGSQGVAGKPMINNQIDQSHNRTSSRQQRQIAAKLTKEDLQPFFQSQQQTSSTQGNTKQQPTPRQTSNMDSQQTSPLLTGGSSAALDKSGAPFGGSIFSYNPLNFFSNNGGGGSTNTTPDVSQNKQKQPHFASSQPHPMSSLRTQGVSIPSDFARQGQFYEDDKLEDEEDVEDQEEDEEEEEEKQAKENDNDDSDQSPRQSTDLYNVFKTASSLFSRPLFGQTTAPLHSKVVGGGMKQDMQRSEASWIRPYPVQQPQHNLSLSFGQDEHSYGGYGRPMSRPTSQDIEEVKRHVEELDGNNNEQDDEQEVDGAAHDEEGEEEEGSSLFSGSLFGGGGVDGGRGEQSIFGYEPQQQHIPQNQWNAPSTLNSGLYNTNTANIRQEEMSALRRNQQLSQRLIESPRSTSYLPPLPTHAGATSMKQGGLFAPPQQSQYHNQQTSMTYQYPPMPPPGLGYRPTGQGQSLYAQYSSSGMTQQYHHNQQSSFQNPISTSHRLLNYPSAGGIPPPFQQQFVQKPIPPPGSMPAFGQAPIGPPPGIMMPPRLQPPPSTLHQRWNSSSFTQSGLDVQQQRPRPDDRQFGDDN